MNTTHTLSDYEADVAEAKAALERFKEREQPMKGKSL
jgi:hypothetical protein